MREQLKEKVFFSAPKCAVIKDVDSYTHSELVLLWDSLPVDGFLFANQKFRRLCDGRQPTIITWTGLKMIMERVRSEEKSFSTVRTAFYGEISELPPLIDDPFAKYIVKWRFMLGR